MKTIQLIKTTTDGEDQTTEVLHEESITDDRWPNAMRRYRLEAERQNELHETDEYSAREAPDVEAS